MYVRENLFAHKHLPGTQAPKLLPPPPPPPPDASLETRVDGKSTYFVYMGTNNYLHSSRWFYFLFLLFYFLSHTFLFLHSQLIDSIELNNIATSTLHRPPFTSQSALT